MLQSSSNPSDEDPLQLNYHDDFGLLTDLSWDHGLPAANLNHFDFGSLDPIPQQSSSFPTPELEFDYTPCLSDISPPLPLLDCFPTLFSVDSTPGFVTPPVYNTPVTTTIQSHSPGPAPPSPDDLDPILFPGLKLPQTANKPSHHSRPGRRPASASHTTGLVLDGRISKHSASPADVDPEVVSRRQRNNVAAKRYRQKKIDRIEELEDQVKEVTQERDDLRIRVARQEAEVAALREMLRMNQKGGKDSS